MSKRNSSYRWIGGLILFALMIMLMLGLSALVSYFSTGASKEDIYHADERYFEKARPSIDWLEDDADIQGSINPYIREDIARAYFQAQRALNLSMELKENVALEEHFNQHLVDKIIRFLSEQTSDVSQVNLSHHLRLHFLSLDKTVVSFTDEYSRTKNKIDGIYLDGSMGYRVNMILVDGRWRIDALEQRLPSEELATSNINSQVEIGNSLLGINYYPAASPWYLFWKNYNKKIIQNDFDVMKNLGYQTVRFFIPFEIFGAGEKNLEMIEKLDHFVETANEKEIELIPTLFDFPVGYELEKYPQYGSQLEMLLKRYESEDAILMWDLKNEPDLDFEYQGKEVTLEWLKFIVERARENTSKPLTIGWANFEVADILCEELDVISFHYYDEVERLESAIISAKSYCDKPVLVSEYGMTSYSGLWPGGHSEEEQMKYFQGIEKILNEQEVAGIAWCLYDYNEAPASVFGRKPWIRATQKKFGILKNDGSMKEVVRNK